MDPLDKFTYEAARSIPNSDLVDLRKEIADLKTKPGADIEDLFYKKAKKLGMSDDEFFREIYKRDKSLLPKGLSPSEYEYSASIAEKNAPGSAAKKFKAVLTEGEKKMARSILSGNIGKAAPMELSMLENLARPAGSALAGAIEAIPPMSKYGGKNPTASLTEAALSPEGSKGIARGVGAMAGLEAGATLGTMSPILKGPAALAGAVGGSMIGAKLGDLLTGIPAIDKAIRASYEKELRKREAKMMAETESSSYLKNPRMADAAPRNMELRPGQ